ncbi:MAG: anaerobic ribonucleoside-triphosphate reductase activating protein [Candidatus Hadarchaeales archaeon]
MISGVVPLSTIDWPGKISVVVFMSGCNMRCPWCQNPDCVLGRVKMEIEEVLRTIERSIPMIDAIILSGGEPTLHPQECFEILKFGKKLGLLGALETNGTQPEVLREILPYLDFLAVDVKAPISDPNLYSLVAGGVRVDTGKIVESLKIAMDSGIELEPRTTIVPGLNDNETIVERICRDLHEIGVRKLRLTQFRNERTLDPEFQKIQPPSREKLIKLAQIAHHLKIDVCIFTAERGLEKFHESKFSSAIAFR